MKRNIRHGSTRGGRFGLKLGQIGTKWDKFGTLQDESLGKTNFIPVPFVDNFGQIQTKCDIPVSSLNRSDIERPQEYTFRSFIVLFIMLIK